VTAPATDPASRRSRAPGRIGGVLAVLEAFFVIAVVIAVGAIVGRTGVLGTNARMVLNRVAFHIGVPALLVQNLAAATLGEIFSLPLLTSALAALLTFALSFGISAGVRRRGRGNSVIAAWTSSYANAGNLGIPLSAYVFGSITEISALVFFQVVVLAPIGLAILNSEETPRPSPQRQLLTLATNPIIAGSAVGLLLAGTGVQIPHPVADPLRLLADLAIPTVLLAFGISLTSPTERTPPANRADVATVVVLKIVVMPAVAYATARWGFGASPQQLILVTVLAALPSAQNINTYAAVYKRNESLARDATLISTAMSVPIIAAIVGVLG
jgi:malonate transporter and related proteins